MLVDFADRSDRGSTWDRERRLTDSLVETTMRFDDLYEPPVAEAELPPPPEHPRGGLGTMIRDFLAALNPALPTR